MAVAAGTCNASGTPTLRVLALDELHQLFFDLRDKYGQTFVIVTHDEGLSQITDRTIRLKDGMVISDGTAADTDAEIAISAETATEDNADGTDAASAPLEEKEEVNNETKTENNEETAIG